MTGQAVRSRALVAILSLALAVPAFPVTAGAGVGTAPVARPDGVRSPQVITAPVPAENAYFGSAIDMSGDTLVVGANEWSIDHDQPGHAYVYTRQADGTWTHQATLEATDAAGGDGFGSAVAIEGDTIAVGASGHMSGPLGNVGAAYVYTRSGGVWTPQVRLEPTTTAMGFFGQAVDLSGDTLAIGENPQSTPTTFFPGAVEVFRGAGAAWAFEAQLFAPDEQRDSGFGQAISLDGDYLLVGARQANAMAGSAYVFKRTGVTWACEQTLVEPTFPEYGTAGEGVALDGDRAFVGVPAHNGTRGHVSMWSRSGAVWSHETTLADPAPFAEGPTYGLGNDVAVDGDFVLVANNYDRMYGVDYCGAVSSFVLTGTDFAYFGKSRAVPPVENGWMGDCVAVSGGVSAAGWQAYSQDATYAGAVLVWDSLPWPRTSEETTLTLPAPGVLRNDRDVDGDPLTASVVATPAHGSLALSSDGSFVYVPELDYFGDDSFTYRAYDGSLYSNTETCTITVRNINDAPVAREDTYTVAAGASLVPSAPGVFANDSDVDSDTLSIHDYTDPSNGTLGMNGDGSFTYTPNGGFTGQDVFYYWSRDPVGLVSEVATVTITVTAPTNPPPSPTPTPSPPNPPPSGDSARRLGGADRYATGLVMSRAAFADGACDSVIIATGRDYPDALSAAGLAGAAGCPILLVEDSFDAATKAEVRRLTQGRSAFTVHIVGGTSAVSRGIEDAIRGQLTGERIVRLGGGNRYDTAMLVAARVRALKGSAVDKAFVVSGRSYQDALLAGLPAYRNAWPILLTDGSRGVDAEVRSALLAAGASDAYVIGSTRSVPEGTRSYLDAGLSRRVTRVAAESDPYRQSVAVAQWASAELGSTFDNVAIATGQEFPDALVAGPMQGAAGSVMLLTHRSYLDAPVREALIAHRAEVNGVRFCGGTAAVSQGVQDAVMAAVR